MMVDGILLERARHRVVAAEGHEAPAGKCREGPASLCLIADEELAAGNQLVNVGVRVTTIDVALAVCSRTQLATPQCQALGVHRRNSGKSRPRRMRHRKRLREVTFADVEPGRGRTRRWHEGY